MGSGEATPRIEVRDLRKRFDGAWAVSGVSFEVRAGEIFGLLGPNGAGKTTTLRVLATLLRPTAGDALVNGYSVVREPQKVRAQLGVLPERAGLYDRLTAAENVRYFARLHGLPSGAIEERLRKLFDALEIDYGDKRAGRLSKGMRQKVALAAALIHEPPVLILDEPTSGLDVLAARKVRQFILRCKGPERAILLSTHLMHEAEALCDRIAIVHQGRILAVGTMEELRAASGARGLEEIFVRLVEEAQQEVGL